MDIVVSHEQIEIAVKDAPVEPLKIALDREWHEETVSQTEGVFCLAKAGTYAFRRAK
jgi:hypothetical protein